MDLRDAKKTLLISMITLSAALFAACMGYVHAPGEASPSFSTYVEVTLAATPDPASPPTPPPMPAAPPTTRRRVTAATPC